MAFQELKFQIKGLAPTIMHNGQLANPLNPIAKRIKEITSKKTKKTDEDLIEIAHLEFLGGLYLDEAGRPCWPGENVEIMIRSAARTLRRGKDVEKAVICDGNWPVEYDGPKDPETLWQDERFRNMAMPKVGTGRVLRCRPMFTNWGLTFVVHYDAEIVNRSDVERWVEIAGREIGLSEWRPKFGRFEVVDVK